MSFPDSGAQQSAAMHAHLEQVAEHGALGVALLQLREALAERDDAMSREMRLTARVFALAEEWQAWADHNEEAPAAKHLERASRELHAALTEGEPEPWIIPAQVAEHGALGAAQAQLVKVRAERDAARTKAADCMSLASAVIDRMATDRDAALATIERLTAEREAMKATIFELAARQDPSEATRRPLRAADSTSGHSDPPDPQAPPERAPG